MEFSEQKKYLIIADREYHRALYHYKSKHPLLDLDIITKSDLIDLLSFSYQKEPIPYLLSKKKWDYSSLKKLLSILRIGNLSGQKEYSDVLQELRDNGYIKETPLGRKLVSEKNVLLFEAEEDFELKEYLSRKNIPFGFLFFEDIDYRAFYSKGTDSMPKIYSFDDKFLQYFYLFSDLRKELLEDKEDKKTFTLLIKDAKDLYYINFISELFDIKVRTVVQTPLLADKEVSDALDSIYKNRNFAISGEIKENSSLDTLNKTIERYGLRENFQGEDDFLFGYSSLMEILSSIKSQSVYEPSGVLLTDEIFFDPAPDDNHIIYVTDFQYDDFYKEFDDNNLMSDSELERIGVNPSFIKTRLDRKKKLNFILHHRFGFLSRPLLHLQDKIYDSQFLHELGWTSSKPQKHNPDGVYTEKAYEFINCYYKDRGHYPKDSLYRSYDHAFHGIQRDFTNKEYHVTDFESYFKCPYSYYLDRILRLSKDDKNIDDKALNRGILIHKVFEDIYTKDYTYFEKAYEDSFREGVEEYKKNKKAPITLEEEVFLEFTKKWLKDVVKAALEQKNYSDVVSEDYEEEVYLTLKDEENRCEYPIMGRIDKIVHTEGANKQKYYNIIDYKSGTSGDFCLDQVFLGGSLQLPLYQLALEEKRNQGLISNGTEDFGGYGIQHLYFKDVPKDSDNCYSLTAIQGKLQIHGITYADPDYIVSFDSTAFDAKKGKLKVNGVFLNTKNSFTFDKEKSAFSDDYRYSDYIEDVKKAAIKTIRSIRRGDFSIRPVKTAKTKEHCQVCPYKDICYHSISDIVDLTERIQERFRLKTEVGDDDQDGTSLEEDYD